LLAYSPLYIFRVHKPKIIKLRFGARARVNLDKEVSIPRGHKAKAAPGGGPQSAAKGMIKAGARKPQPVGAKARLGRRRAAPAGLWTTESNIPAMKRC
jgi:hypothetical protein